MSRPLRGSGPISTAIRELQEKAQQNTAQRSSGSLVDSHPLGSNVRVKTQGGAQRQSRSTIPRYV